MPKCLYFCEVSGNCLQLGFGLSTAVASSDEDFFFSFFFFFWGGGLRRFPPPRIGAKYGHFRADRFLFGRSVAKGNARTKKKEDSSKKTPKKSLKQSPKATDTVKGPCKHNQLHVYVSDEVYT